jgi:hypothetical protein
MSNANETQQEAETRHRRTKAELQLENPRYTIFLPTTIADGQSALLFYLNLGLNPQLKKGVFEGQCCPEDKEWVVAFSAPTHRYVLRYKRKVIGGFKSAALPFVPNK